MPPDPPEGLLSPTAALAAPTNSTAGVFAPPAWELFHQVKVYLWGKSCEPWAGSTGLIFYGIQVKHSRDCRGLGFVAQGLCQCSQGTWQQQQEVCQDFSPPTGSPATHGGLFSTAGVTAALQDTQRPHSACSSWILIPKSPKNIPLSPAIAVSWRATGFGSKASAGIDFHLSRKKTFPHIQSEHLLRQFEAVSHCLFPGSRA